MISSFMDFLEEKEAAPLVGKGTETHKSGGQDLKVIGKDISTKDKHQPTDKSKIQAVKSERKPLGDEATPGITPKTSSGCVKPDNDVEYVKSKKKLTSEQFVEQTSRLTEKEFAKFMLEANSPDKTMTTVTDLFGNEFTPEPSQSIQYVCGLILNNPNMMRRFVMEVRRRDGLNDMMGEMMDHGETYTSMVDHLECPEHGKGRCNRLADELNDSYSNKADQFEVEEDMFPESTSPGVEELYGDESEEAEEQPQNPSGEQEMTPKPEMPPVEKKMSSGGKGKLKFKGESAAHHLIHGLSEFPHFRDHMKSKVSEH